MRQLMMLSHRRLEWRETAAPKLLRATDALVPVQRIHTVARRDEAIDALANPPAKLVLMQEVVA